MSPAFSENMEPSVLMATNHAAKDLGTTGNPSHEENQYLDLIRQIMSDGEHRPDR